MPRAHRPPFRRAIALSSGAFDEDVLAVGREQPDLGAFIVDVPEEPFLEVVHHLAVLHLVPRLVLCLLHHLVAGFGHVGHELIADVLPGLKRDGDDVRRHGADVLDLRAIRRVRGALRQQLLSGPCSFASASRRAFSASLALSSLSFARSARSSSVGGTSSIPESTTSTGLSLQSPMTMKIAIGAQAGRRAGLLHVLRLGQRRAVVGHDLLRCAGLELAQVELVGVAGAIGIAEMQVQGSRPGSAAVTASVIAGDQSP